jgi:hypothetical protein
MDPSQVAPRSAASASLGIASPLDRAPTPWTADDSRRGNFGRAPASDEIVRGPNGDIRLPRGVEEGVGVDSCLIRLTKENVLLDFAIESSSNDAVVVARVRLSHASFGHFAALAGRAAQDLHEH